jgi:hypothetical protein
MGTVGKTFRVARARFRVWAEPCPTGVQCIRGTPSLRRVSQYDGPASPSLASPPTALTRSSTHATTCPLSSRMHISPPLALRGILAASPAGAALDADRPQATAAPAPQPSVYRQSELAGSPPSRRTAVPSPHEGHPVFLHRATRVHRAAREDPVGAASVLRIGIRCPVVSSRARAASATQATQE